MRDIVGNDGRVFPHTEKQGGLSLAKKVNSHEMQSRYHGACAIDLERKTVIIKRGRPRKPGSKIGPETACENHRSEAGQVDLRWSGANESAGLQISIGFSPRSTTSRLNKSINCR